MSEPVAITLDAEGAITDVDFRRWILNEIEDTAVGRKYVAQTYAILIQKGHKDFREINTAILNRWSMSGLQWIKTQAWKSLKQQA